MHIDVFWVFGRKHAAAASAENMCWMPTFRRHQHQYIMMWISIMKMDNNRICKRVYQAAKHHAETSGVTNWSLRIRDLLTKCNLGQWWMDNACKDLNKKECKEMITSILFRLERSEWQNEMLSKPKLRTYRLFKCEYAPEPYINVVTCRAHRAFLAKLRGGSAPLEIETGRYVGTLPHLRVCELCNTGVEDEMHFTLQCAALC